MLALNTLAIGAASVFAVVTADHGHLLPRAHHHNVSERSENHQKRSFPGRATFYKTGLGACGKYNNDGDKIVALNSAQYGGGYPGPNCFKMIDICKGSNCHSAQIVDECPTCDWGGLDMSPSLFNQFATPDDGVFQMTWTFSDGNDEPTTTEKPEPPKTTYKPDPPKTTSKEPEPEPEPTTTKEKPTTTSKKHTSTTVETTSTPEPTTSTSTSTSSEPATTSTSEAKSSTSVTSEIPTTVITSATPTATPSPGTGSSSGDAPNSGTGPSGSNLVDMNQAMLAMGHLVAVAQK